MTILVISGTGTGVGKTIVTAALAARAAARGRRVAVVKPGQTGLLPGEPGDLDVIRRLTGVEDLHEHARFPDPLSPAAAARRARLPCVDLRESAARIRELARHRSLVLVEGAGGLLVRYDERGTTIADLAGAVGASVCVTAAAGLGTLNETALTLEALTRRGLTPAGIVIGSWPAQPDVAAHSNIRDLTELAGEAGTGLRGSIPAGAGRLGRAEFAAAARTCLQPGAEWP